MVFHVWYFSSFRIKYYLSIDRKLALLMSTFYIILCQCYIWYSDVQLFVHKFLLIVFWTWHIITNYQFFLRKIMKRKMWKNCRNLSQLLWPRWDIIALLQYTLIRIAIDQQNCTITLSHDKGVKHMKYRGLTQVHYLLSARNTLVWDHQIHSI